MAVSLGTGKNRLLSLIEYYSKEKHCVRFNNTLKAWDIATAYGTLSVEWFILEEKWSILNTKENKHQHKFDQTFHQTAFLLYKKVVYC